MQVSIGIVSCPMDPMDSIGSIFYPDIQYGRLLSKCLMTRPCPFPSESFRIRSIFYPNIEYGLYFSKCLKTRTCTFPSETRRVRWIRWIPSDRFPTPISNMGDIFLSVSWLELARFHWNLFVSDGSDGFHRIDFLTQCPIWVKFL